MTERAVELAGRSPASALPPRLAGPARALLLAIARTGDSERVDRIARVATDLLPACDAAEVAVVDHGVLVTAGATCSIPAGSSRRAPEPLGFRRLAPELRLHGMQSSAWLPFGADGDAGTAGGTALVVHSRGPDVLLSAGAGQVDLVTRMATVLLANLAMADEVENLRVALRSNRRIGMAIGVIVERMQLTDERAFGVLRTLSQRTHRKLADVAEEILLTGEIGQS